MIASQFLLPVVVSVFATQVSASVAPVVTLDYGSFRGAIDGNLSTFLGIPFAAPAERFMLPKLPLPLKGVQDATAFGPACIQQTLSPLPTGPLPAENFTSEDCLTVNVFAPRTATPHSKLPVFVWIYGGGFQVGASHDQDFPPLVERSIANGEPMVVVSLNYRLSAFGFLAGKEVAAAGITNLGLRDQIFALEWVQRHVTTFGGDPKRVVISGLSAGAISVGLMLLHNKRFHQGDLFHGAFMISGSPGLTTLGDGQPDYDGLVVANHCQAANDTLECLRQVPLDDFLATVNETPNFLSFLSGNLIWGPRVDGDVVVQDATLSVSEGSFAKIPLVTGDVDDEGTLFSLSTLNITTNDEFKNYVHSNYFPGASNEQISKISTLYPADPAQGSPFDTGTANELTPEYKRLAAFQGDYFFIGARRFLLEHAPKTQNTWSYLYKRGKSTPVLGASHGTDITTWIPLANATDFVAADALINFVNTLDPNRSANKKAKPASVHWPTWNTPSADGSTSLLTFSDPVLINITADNFRAEAIRGLYDIVLALREGGQK